MLFIESNSIRAAVQRMDPDYDFAGSAHSLCFYKDEIFDPNDPDKGFLQSHWLLQVCLRFLVVVSSLNSLDEDIPDYLHLAFISQRTI